MLDDGELPISGMDPDDQVSVTLQAADHLHRAQLTDLPGLDRYPEPRTGPYG